MEASFGFAANAEPPNDGPWPNMLGGVPVDLRPGGGPGMDDGKYWLPACEWNDDGIMDDCCAMMRGFAATLTVPELGFSFAKLNLDPCRLWPCCWNKDD